MPQQYFCNADKILLVFDLTNKDSYSYIKDYLVINIKKLYYTINNYDGNIIYSFILKYQKYFLQKHLK